MASSMQKNKWHLCHLFFYMEKEMKKRIMASMLILSILLSCFFTIKSHASELAVTVGLASSGTALLGLLGLSGVGMELENNKKFTDLSEEDKTRLENGLAQNFEEVAIQRGASLEKIKNWITDLCNGVLDKASECWDIFKEWSKNISLSSGGGDVSELENNQPLSIDTLLGYSFTAYNGENYTIDSSIINNIKNKVDTSKYYGYIVYSPNASSLFQIVCINNNSSYDYISKDNSCIVFRVNQYVNGEFSVDSGAQGNSLLTYLVPSNNSYLKCVVASKPVYFLDNSWNVLESNKNGYGFTVKTEYFNTNTDYLERLRGSDTVEVIDVTDIKNPIIETIPNTKAEIDFNRGTKRPSNKNDDDDEIVGGLVPADVWYHSLDDYIEQQNNAIVEYDNHINENPDDKDKYFIATTPITNIHNYYNTLPVINIPTGGTVVNNYYEYNNYNNNNVTIYELPYNSELIPLLPTLFFENKFPFCIPWDIYSFINIFRSEAVAPHFEIPYPYMDENGLQTYTLVIDLSEYNYVSNIFRVMFFILFIVGLMILTRKLIKG